jgi:hypothetical protein
MHKFNKLIKLFDIKSLTILSVILAIIFKNIGFNQKCFEIIMNKIPVSITSNNHNRNEEILFIGGTRYSGERLIKEILNIHSNIYCQGEKTSISKILMNSLSWQTGREAARLEHAGISRKIIDSSISSFILDILSESGQNGKGLCSKDLSIFNYINKTIELFPNSKYLLMIRDPKSSIYEQVKRGNRSENVPLVLKFRSWIPLMDSYYQDCVRFSAINCLPVYYEKLVNNEREAELKRIFKFLNLPWHAEVMNYEKKIQNLNEIERPINENLIKTWINELPKDSINQLENISQFLKKIGYR